MELNKIKKFTSKLDGSTFDYFIEDNILSFKYDGTDWQDFVPNDKRAYSEAEHQEMMDLLEGRLEGTLEGEFIAGFHD
tara:strand:- start:1216 stop:1449 length:234 start_codon:yes stop_codon:yes gene_type:complete